MASSEISDHDRCCCCFQEWIKLQESDLSELLQALNPLHANDDDNNNRLSQLAEKGIKHFQDYMDKRARLASDDVSVFFAPTWCTNLENSLLWIAGCRPSVLIRLIYALCGSQLESQLAEFLQGRRTGNLGELSARQLAQVNTLQCKTIREEEKLSTRMASLHEDIADHPLAMIAKESIRVGELNGDADRALDGHARDMLSILEEADKLRLNTLKEVVSVLTPVQAVEFLAAGKKLHLSMHEWGMKRDQRHGRN